MRRLIHIILILAFSCFSAAPAIHHKIDFNDDNFQLLTRRSSAPTSIIRWGEMLPIGLNGEFALPKAVLAFALPNNSSNVKITNLKISNGKQIHLDYPVSVIQAETWNGDTEPMEIANAELFLEKSVSPVNICTQDNFNGLSDILTLTVCPLKYDYNKQSLQLYNSIEFDIEYNEDLSKSLTMERTHANSILLEELSLIQAIVQNPNDLQEKINTLNTFSQKSQVASQSSNPYQEKASKGITIHGLPVYEYSIVTSRNLVSAFQRLIAIKRIQGYDAGIVCIEDILSNKAYANGDTISRINDDAGKLRQYLHYAYQKGTRFVLLGGKPPIVPIRYARYSLASGANNKDIPSDLYFSNVTDSWNKNFDRYYGDITPPTYESDRISFIPQLFVGRLLCTDEQEIINYTNKLEDYTFNPGNGDFSYLNKGFMTFSYEFFTPDNDDEVDGYDGIGMLQPAIKSFIHQLNIIRQHYDTPLGKDIISMLNEEKFGFVSFIGHGSPEGISVKYSYPERLSRYANGINALDNEHIHLPNEDCNGLDNLNNIHYPSFSYTASCSTTPFDCPKYQDYGKFNNSEYNDLSCNFGESYTLGQNYGGIAYLGNTRDTYKEKGELLMSRFFNMLFTGSKNPEKEGLLLRVGVAEAMSKTIEPSDVTYSYNKLAHNLIGDPATPIWYDEPIVSDNFKIKRYNDHIIITDDTSVVTEHATRLAVAIEPSGNVHKTEFKGKEIILYNIDPNSLISVVENGYLPYIADGTIHNTTFNKDIYAHANRLYLGVSAPENHSTTGQTIIADSTTITFDVKDICIIDEGLLIKKGATLIIYANDQCQLKGVQIEDSGKLIIYGDNVTISNNIPTPKGEILVYKYNKYHEQQEELVTRRSQKRSSVSKTVDYTPLLEIGKEWRYTIYHHNVYSDKKPDRKAVLKLNERKIIDNKEYYSFTLTDDLGSDDYYDYYRQHSFYLSEDIETRRVYINSLDEDGNINSSEVLYDFSNPRNAELTNAPNTNTYEQTVLDSFGRHYNAWLIGDPQKSFEACALVEGMGYITHPLLEHAPDRHCFGVLPYGLSGYPASDCELEKLYEIVDGNGEVIYSLDTARPGYTTGICSTHDNQTTIIVKNNNLTITDHNEIGTVQLYNTTGTIIRQWNLSENYFATTLPQLAKGIYFIRTKDCVIKFTAE